MLPKQKSKFLSKLWVTQTDILLRLELVSELTVDPD
jgi:hypothetical protein